MLAKWLIKVSNYLRDWASLPSNEWICISSLLGLWQEARCVWTLYTDPPYLLLVFQKDLPFPRFHSCTDHKGTETQKRKMLNSYLTEQRVCVHMEADGFWIMCLMCVYIVVHTYVMCVNMCIWYVCTCICVWCVKCIMPTSTCLMFVPIFDVWKRKINHFKEREGKGYQEINLTGPSTWNDLCNADPNFSHCPAFSFLPPFCTGPGLLHY